MKSWQLQPNIYNFCGQFPDFSGENWRLVRFVLVFGGLDGKKFRSIPTFLLGWSELISPRTTDTSDRLQMVNAF